MTSSPDPSLTCSQCGGALTIHFSGELPDKRATCPYCGKQIDLPDSYQRVQRRQTQDGDRFTYETISETRSDHPLTPEALENLPPALQDLLNAIISEGPDALNSETLAQLKASGIEVNVDTEHIEFLAEQGTPIEFSNYFEHQDTTTFRHVRDESSRPRKQGWLQRFWSWLKG